MDRLTPLLDSLSREQLVSLLYQILNRLLSPSQMSQAERTVQASSIPTGEGRLVVDPTIDAWEHTGVYPQGFASLIPGASTPPGRGHAGFFPQFGSPVPALASQVPPASLPSVAFVGPPCTVFGRPWQPGIHWNRLMISASSDKRQYSMSASRRRGVAPSNLLGN